MQKENGFIIKPLILFFSFGLLLRFGYVLFVPQMVVQRGDSASYNTIAQNLSEGRGYTLDGANPDLCWAPGYPFFIAMIYKIFGINYAAVRAAQALLSALVILMLYSIGEKIFGRKVAVLSAAVTALYPGFIGYCGLFTPQSLAMFLIVLFIFLIVRTDFNLNFYTTLFLGVAAGYSVLIRSELLLFWPVFLSVALFTARGNRKFLKSSALILVSMCVVISLWTFRNYRVFGKPVLVSIHYGDMFWYSTWKGEWLEYRADGTYLEILEKGLGPVETADLLFKAGLNNIKEHPFIYLKMCFKRLYRFWLTGHSNIFYFMQDSLLHYLRNKEYAVFILKSAMIILNSALIITGFMGIPAAYSAPLGRKRYPDLILAPILFFVILHFFLFATPRYAIPIMPFMILFSSLILSGRPKINRVYAAKDSACFACP